MYSTLKDVALVEAMVEAVDELKPMDDSSDVGVGGEVGNGVGDKLIVVVDDGEGLFDGVELLVAAAVTVGVVDVVTVGVRDFVTVLE